MKIQSFQSYEFLSQGAALYVANVIKNGLAQQGKFVLGLATGSSPIGMYQRLLPLLSKEQIDLTNLHTFNLDEYTPITSLDPHSYYQEMYKGFWRPLNQINPTFNLDNAHIPSGETDDTETESARYEALIQAQGGIDLQILGIGTNGHIAFNEPGSEPTSRTRKVQIAEETRVANSRFYDNVLERVPQYAISMGMGTILEAKEIVVLISGESKRNVFTKLMSMNTPATDLPASYLKEHANVTIFTDLQTG